MYQKLKAKEVVVVVSGRRKRINKINVKTVFLKVFSAGIAYIIYYLVVLIMFVVFHIF